ncbi:hypothetical protein EUGRSUZ_D00143 [Eucalyptus grandis]|uniref:Uncharacterized protein n=2 Tax=Eucalyptus grandis TaxID=71139 RepID=A0ACC3L409_EUCGR|nr:hypothetical protein EUGRSUZ_D00143 [Eucalyptus grandis]
MASFGKNQLQHYIIGNDNSESVHLLQSPDCLDAGGRSRSGGWSGGGGGGGAAAPADLSFRNFKRKTSPEANNRVAPVIPHTMLATKSTPLTCSLLPLPPSPPPYPAPRHHGSSLEFVPLRSGNTDGFEEEGDDGDPPKEGRRLLGQLHSSWRRILELQPVIGGSQFSRFRLSNICGEEDADN